MMQVPPFQAHAAAIRLLTVCVCISMVACNQSRSGILETEQTSDISPLLDTVGDAVSSDISVTDDVIEPVADVREPTADGCSGAAPFCVDACLDDLFQQAVCLVDTWACPPNTQPVDDCPSTPAACAVVSTSEIPGVRIELQVDDCTVSLADALNAPITFPYTVVVDSDLELALGGFDGAPCVRPDNTGVATLPTLTGSGGRYCECDFGRCSSPEGIEVTLRTGRYPGRLTWPGRSWNGPSDTGEPLGEVFALGTYVLDVRAEYLDGDGVSRRVAAHAAAVIQVVP